VWGIKLLRQTSWLPWVLGGTGDTTNCWVGYPFQEPFDGVKEYYLFQLGYHCHSLIFLVRLIYFQELTSEVLAEAKI
jgi:hypothetical protein